MEVMDDIARAARTSQSSRDLEAMYLEFKSLRAARERLSFYGMQRAQLMSDRTAGRAGAPVVHYNVGISTISDYGCAVIFLVNYQ